MVRVEEVDGFLFSFYGRVCPSSPVLEELLWLCVSFRNLLCRSLMTLLSSLSSSSLQLDFFFLSFFFFASMHLRIGRHDMYILTAGAKKETDIIFIFFFACSPLIFLFFFIDLLCCRPNFRLGQPLFSFFIFAQTKITCRWGWMCSRRRRR